MRPIAYRRNARGLRDRQAFEGVRMQAGALFAAGHSQAEVARQLGVARQNVSRWHAQWQAGGPDALRSAGPTGPTPRLSEQQLHAVDQALRAKQLPVRSAEIALLPKNTVKVEGGEAKQLLQLVEGLEEMDDVSKVFSNFDIDAEAMAAVTG